GQLHLIFMTSDHMVLHPCDSYKLTGALDVHPHENYIYVAGLRGLYVFEIENPGYLSMKLKRTSGFATSGSAKAIYILNNYAFLGGTKGLYILNVSDINKIVEVGFYKTKHSIKDVFVWNDLAFIAETSMVAPDNNGNIRRFGGGLRIIKISDPSNQQLAGFYDFPGNPGSEEYGKVYYDGKYVYMTDGSTFSIYKHISPDSN
ncbi:MAG: hypothetical protein KAR38_02870, partial [Calditrichia bacterium]|nr:hypothetical protein [Calditrichia bacterium]